MLLLATRFFKELESAYCIKILNDWRTKLVVFSLSVSNIEKQTLHQSFSQESEQITPAAFQSLYDTGNYSGSSLRLALR